MKIGKAYLVGAGPGDEGLLTLKGKKCIEEAEVIIYDRLANPRLLEMANKNCEMIYVGKASSDHTMTQEDINLLIAKKALEGKVVTRLKGGDPYVFGRGGEEAQVLVEHGVEFEVVPGITSGIAGLCYAGIPITHRDYASSLHLITGHLKEEEEDLDWNALAKLKGTLVFYMGVKNLDSISKNLIREGMDKETPVAIINWATHPRQKVVTGTLENIYQIAIDAKIKPPSLIAVGKVVSLRDELNFFEKKPLFGKKIVVTRARAQASKLTDILKEKGAEVIECPSIEISKIEPNEELNEAIKNIVDYTHIIFTSQNAVDIFFEELYKEYDARSLKAAQIVSIGPATTKQLKKYGIKADMQAKEFVAEGVIESLEGKLNKDSKILLPRAKEAREKLALELAKICEVKEIHIYETIKGINDEEILSELENQKIDYITFTSSSTVKNFYSMLNQAALKNIEEAKIISIGPITSKTVEDMNKSVYKEADEYTIDGVVKAIESIVIEGMN